MSTWIAGKGTITTVTTNYDFLVRKTPEELAKWLGDRDICPPGSCQHMYDGVDCSECWLDWLEQGVVE